MKTSKYCLCICLLSLPVLPMLNGCASTATEHFYTLNYERTTAVPGQATAPAYEILLDSVKIPDAINRPQLVVQLESGEVSMLEHQRWLAPLEEQISLALAGNLRASLPSAWVSTEPAEQAKLPRFRLRIEVQRLLLIPGKSTELDISWVLTDKDRKVLRRQHQLMTVPVASSQYAALAASVSEAIRQLSTAIALDIKALQAS
ncbi:membrane integrity-associated transporter subunit PqiC [Undibacterium sp. CY7W]|uniref:Membrane integrity-associated transporter subunit PqiC n=1 Tax=Undibacterium rugosum TaxID=2762291 RepID=A0A923I5D3_9BURK|nr:PqiC family protein [Undibacterium rugosum]MBC3936852.1 membrane integrity-associated transporter subunit PqiC [Undibacterium rugosum]